jgi:hypothetical protein
VTETLKHALITNLLGVDKKTFKRVRPAAEAPGEALRPGATSRQARNNKRIPQAMPMAAESGAAQPDGKPLQQSLLTRN